jgi:hypothetical protein
MERTIAFAAPAATVYQEFAGLPYWEALIEHYRVVTPDSELTRFASGDAGVDVAFTHTVPRDLLPPLARNAIPVDMVVVRDQHFDPFDPSGDGARGTYGAGVKHIPGRFSGRYRLTDTDAGSELELASECKVGIPLIGGKLEELALAAIANVFSDEEAFTAEWITRHS